MCSWGSFLGCCHFELNDLEIKLLPKLCRHKTWNLGAFTVPFALKPRRFVELIWRGEKIKADLEKKKKIGAPICHLTA